MIEPTQEQWEKFFRIKSIELMEKALAKYSIEIDPSIMPFCRALWFEAFCEGMQFSADNTTEIASGKMKKLMKQVIEYQSRSEKIIDMQTYKVQ